MSVSGPAAYGFDDDRRRQLGGCSVAGKADLSENAPQRAESGLGPGVRIVDFIGLWRLTEDESPEIAVLDNLVGDVLGKLVDLEERVDQAPDPY